MRIDIGHLALLSAFVLSLVGLGAGIFGARSSRQSWREVSSRALVSAGAFALISLVSLAVAFLQHDYHYAYVWRTSNNAMHPVYLISAVWGGMDGSMLLWASLMSFYGALVALRMRSIHAELYAWVVVFLHGANAFFFGVVTFLTNPFRLIPSSVLPADGNGLNPLLQNPSMIIHPPSLYLGFTGFVVPAAFALASLACPVRSIRWVTLTRRWTLVAWAFLTAGIILGGNWAYIELGWGGFWAWDPVENASFLPWLSATAYLHSVMVEERRGMLRVWNIILSVLTYALAVFGTFLTRSGIVQSVHAFASSEVGEVFLFYLGLIAIVTAILLLRRLKDLKPDNHFESVLSREAIFLLNNLFLLAICFSVIWGVMLPVITEAVTGSKSVVGPPFFNTVTVPFFLALLFLMGVGPLLAWRGMTLNAVLKLIRAPLTVGFVVALLGLIVDPSRPYAALAFGLSVLVATSVMLEFRRAVKVRRELVTESAVMGAIHLIRTKPRRYGGLLVHFGVAVMAIAITAATVYKIEKDFTLNQGESIEVGRFRLELGSLSEAQNSNYSALLAEVSVFDRFTGEQLTTLHPERRFYPQSEETTTEVDIRMTLRDDLYLALAGVDGVESDSELAKAKGVFKVFVNPLQIWLWFGSLIVVGGTVAILQAERFAARSVNEPQAVPVTRGIKG